MEAHWKVRSLEWARVIVEKEGLEEFADLKEGFAKKRGRWCFWGRRDDTPIHAMDTINLKHDTTSVWNLIRSNLNFSVGFCGLKDVLAYQKVYRF